MCAANTPEPENVRQGWSTIDALDAATVEVGRLSNNGRTIAKLCQLSSSDLLVRWRQFCLTHKRFTPPDWETGEAGMLRELIRHVLETP